MTIIQEPYDVSFSKNPLLWKMKVTDASGDDLQVFNVRAELLDPFLAIVENDTITVTWTTSDNISNAVLFTAKDNPVTDVEIPTNLTTGLASFSDLFEAIATKMNAHLATGADISFSQKFNGSSNSLRAEAREADASFVLEFSGALANGAGMTITNNIAPTSTVPAGHKVLFEVFFDRDGIYERLAENEVWIDDDSEVMIDVAGIIDAAFEEDRPALPIPAFVDKAITKLDTVRSYYIRYREDYNGLTGAAWTVTTAKKVMFGGISSKIFTAYNYFDNITDSNSLLTWYPDGKNVSSDQPEWLAWYNYTGADKNIMLAITRIDVNGTEDNTPAFNTTPFSAKAGEVSLIPAGIGQLDILTTQSGMTRYKVRVIDADDWAIHTTTAYSPWRSFYYDNDYYLSKRYLFYLNGFNAIETLRCVGDDTQKLDIKRHTRDYISVPLSPTSRNTDQYNQDWQRPSVYRSGYLSKTEVDALSELLIYAQFWEVSQGQEKKLRMLSSRFTLHETRQFLNAISFEAVRVLSERNYSSNEVTSGGYIKDDTGSIIVDDSGSPLLPN